MFENYSPRSMQVITVALWKAGERGAAEFEIDDLLMGLIVEDQGRAAETVFREPSHGSMAWPQNLPRYFLSPEAANNLLARMEALSTKSEPLPLGSEMPISVEVKRVLGEATRLRDELQQRRVQPLHLLAAALAEDSNKAVQAFLEAGITRESVLKALQEETGS